MNLLQFIAPLEPLEPQEPILQEHKHTSSFKFTSKKELQTHQAIQHIIQARIPSLSYDIVIHIISFLRQNDYSTLLSCFLVFGNIFGNIFKKDMTLLLQPINIYYNCRTTNSRYCNHLIYEPVSSLSNLLYIFDNILLLLKFTDNNSAFLKTENGRRFIIYLLKQETKIDNNARLYDINIVTHKHLANIYETIDCPHINKLIFTILSKQYKCSLNKLNAFSLKERAIMLRGIYYKENMAFPVDNNSDYYNYDLFSYTVNHGYGNPEWSYLIIEGLKASSRNIIDIITDNNMHIKERPNSNYIDFYIIHNKHKLKQSIVRYYLQQKTKYINDFIIGDNYNTIYNSIEYAYQIKHIDYLKLLLSIPNVIEKISRLSLNIKSSSSNCYYMSLLKFKKYNNFNDDDDDDNDDDDDDDNVNDYNNNVIYLYDDNYYTSITKKLTNINQYCDLDIEVINKHAFNYCINKDTDTYTYISIVDSQLLFIRYTQIVISIIESSIFNIIPYKCDNPNKDINNIDILLTIYNNLLNYNSIGIENLNIIKELRKSIPKSVPMLKRAILSFANKIVCYATEIYECKMLIDKYDKNRSNLNNNILSYVKILNYLYNAKELLYHKQAIRNAIKNAFSSEISILEESYNMDKCSIENANLLRKTVCELNDKIDKINSDYISTYGSITIV